MSSNQVNVTLDKTTPIVCSCENEIFIEGVLLRKASRFITGTSQDGIIPVPVFTCSKCGEVLEETLPLQLRKDAENIQ